MDILAAFQVFVRVSESGSFSAVAREMGLSQPAISRQIAALEDHFGERLLHRTTRSLTLTDDGRDLLVHASRVLESLQEAETAVGRRRGTVAGMVRLSVPVIFGRLYVTPRIGKLLQAHPALELDILFNDGLADLVAEGIDLAVRAGMIADSSLITRSMGSVARHAMASAEYLQRRGTPEVPADLLKHDCLMFTQGASPTHWSFEGKEGRVSIPIRGRFRSDSGEGVREAVISGYGIGLLPTWYFRDEIQEGSVKILFPEWQVPGVPVHLIYPSRRHLSPRVRVVMDFLIDEYANAPVFAEPLPRAL
jgi:DNA-binding transcriptional LysR family regulator